MSILLKKKFSSDKAFFLCETLQLKKELESQYLSGNDKVENNALKFGLKSYLITNLLSFFFQNNIQYLIQLLEKRLNGSFSSYKLTEKTFTIDNINNVEFPPLFFEELVVFNSRLEKYNSNLIVQGSYADNTFISYSDIDLVIIGILSPEIRAIKKEIDSYLLKLDPLQHHGVFFINKNSFDNYWQMDLPISTLKKSLLLSKKSTLQIKIDYSFKEYISAHNWILNFINGYPELPFTLNTGVFFAKYFISQLLLVPALFIATKENYIYKGDSFFLAKKYFTDKAWECIEFASIIRGRWDQTSIDSRYKSARENSTMKNVEEFNILSDVIDFNKEELKEFAKKYHLFIDETKNILITRGY